jgi:Ca2+-dependent lipid-binding protein
MLVRILIEHCQDLPTLQDSHTAPEPYVKIYLVENNEKIISSKRKTTISHRTCHPTFNQVIDYFGVENLKEKFIEVSVWSYMISGNVQIGKIELQLNQSYKGWFPLQATTRL